MSMELVDEITPQITIELILIETPGKLLFLDKAMFFTKKPIETSTNQTISL